MTDAIHEQLSAFLDGELSAAESELLLKRVERDPELSARLKRHMLIGDGLRATQAEGPSRGFSSRVSEALAAESLPGRARWVASQWLKPVAGGAIAAGVAAMVLVSLRTQPDAAGVQMAGVGVAPTEVVSMPVVSSALTVDTRVASQSNVPATDGSDRFVVPGPSSNRAAPPIRVMNQGQLANYVVAHSEYSSPLGRRNVLTGLLAEEVDADQADFFLLEDAEREALQKELARERTNLANKPVARQNGARAVSGR
ncbi:MAG TPA: sigma-E factor negative regulatory protein [Steroidobacteraceae bacterium]|nr:sigma-E factor negative regulatory protein [Steroidobacteraceae bacterium]